MAKDIQKPELIIKESGYCGGCGHGIIQRLIAECLEELNIADKTMQVVDIACCFWALDALNIDGIAGPHGRCAAVATGVKKARPEDIVYIHAGDGASYTIGLAETMHAAMRDVPITMIVVNNGIFGMTGGQMAPATTPIGDKTTSSMSGRQQELHGSPADILLSIANYDTEFVARGALYDIKQIMTTKKYIKKALQNQIDNKGFSLVEILSPCPTNWGISAVAGMEKTKTLMTEVFPLKVYTDRQSANKGE